jgi:hypothetical protein
MSSLLQESDYGIHGRPHALREDDQEDPFVVRPCCFPAAWRGCGLMLLMLSSSVLLLRHYVYEDK